MAVNSSRSMNSSLREGATDGKYRKVRPNTEVIAGQGHEKVMQDRATLNPFQGYGFATSEYDDKVVPGL